MTNKKIINASFSGIQINGYKADEMAVLSARTSPKSAAAFPEHGSRGHSLSPELDFKRLIENDPFLQAYVDQLNKVPTQSVHHKIKFVGYIGKHFVVVRQNTGVDWKRVFQGPDTELFN